MPLIRAAAAECSERENHDNTTIDKVNTNTCSTDKTE